MRSFLLGSRIFNYERGKIMSRFVKPEMEVIRFTEEDVIVASGKKSDVQMKGAVLSNFLNGKENKYVIINYMALRGC